LCAVALEQDMVPLLFEITIPVGSLSENLIKDCAVRMAEDRKYAILFAAPILCARKLQISRATG
jgi:hypothetical protein